MRTWQRFRALSAGDRRLVVEAAAWLVAARFGLLLLPFPALRRALSSASCRFPALDQSASATPAPVAWAITSAARHLPMHSTCLIESLAGHAMLRRRGFDCDLRLGVRRPSGRSSFAAHAWIEHRGSVVLGKVDDLSEYAILSEQ
jgi:hypothetical protein